MKKIFLFVAIAALVSSFAMAQEPDLKQISKMREAKVDSMSMMLGKVYGAQAAMDHTTAEARQTFLKAFNEAMSIEQKDEDYREGASIAEQFYRNAEGINNQLGINMSRMAFTNAFLTRLNDTTSTKPINDEMREINMEAKRLMEEIGELKKDSIAPQTALIDIKADSLSQNMGRFFGAQMQNNAKKKNLSEADMAQFLDGFNSSISIDENNKPLVDGRMLASYYTSLVNNAKKQLNININKEAFLTAMASTLNDPKVPTKEEFSALDTQTQAYIKETQAFLKENSPEALTQKGLGQKYIESQMEKDPNFIQSPSGLVYKILNPGNGKNFSETDKIKVMYKGTHVDGSTFDESKEPATFAPNQVVPGFKEALLMMSPGAKMIAILPYNLAYGERGAGQSIKPYETLVFEIETLGIDDSAPVAQPAAKIETPATTKEKPNTGNQKSNKKSTGKKTNKKHKK